MFLTRISVGQPVFATMVILAMVVLGYFSWQRTPVELFPNIDFPVVVVQTSYAGASPEAVENDISRPIENVVNTVGGLDTLTSRSYAGLSVVIAQFTLDVDSSEAAQEVRDKVSTIEAALPDSADKPQISRFDPSAMPIMSVIVSSDTMPVRELTTLADKSIVDRLTVVPGVGSANLVGGVSRQINVLVDDDRMRALNVGINEVMNALRSENRDLPAGEVEVGFDQRNVQIKGAVADPKDFGKLIVARRGGEPVYLWQVATIEDGQEDSQSRALFNGKPAVAIDIVKIDGANTIGVAEGVHKVIAELNGTLPAGVTLQVIRDGSVPISNSVDNVQTTLVEGGVLAVLIVFLFLNSWRSTVITGLTLPVSVIATFGALYFLGFTLNMMTLMALSLAIGILIDDAIVVRENITRHLHMGKSHKRAALEGTKEIGLAVLATSLSIMAVFLPVAFMGGIIGRFFLQFGVTVAVAVAISLFVSFTLDPMLSSVWYDPAANPKTRRSIVGRVVGLFDRGFEAIGRGYGRVVAFSLRHRLLTVIAVVAVFVASIMMVPRVGVEFFPAEDQGEFTLAVETPAGSSVDYTAAKLQQVQAALREFPAVELTYTTINAGQSNGTNRASVYVKLVPLAERTETPTSLAEPIRERLSQIAGITSSVTVAGPAGDGKPIQINVLGPGIDTLRGIADDLVKRIEAIPGTADIESSLDADREVYGITINRDVASDLGIGTQSIADALRPMLSGDTVTTWKDSEGETYDVVVRLPQGQRADLVSIEDLPITFTTRTGAQASVPLRQVAEISVTTGAVEIVRQDLARQAQVSGNVAGRPLGEVSSDIAKVIGEMQLPAGYRISLGGDTEAMNESLGYAGSALIMAVLFIYFVLASQFGSFLQPLAIMVSLPLSLIGVVLGLLVTGSTLNMMSAIGFIMLMGLVVKNAILLVDNANQRRREGQDLRSALVEAGKVRFRPIIMTTLAMIFGMMPLALGLGEGGEFRAPMAHAVIGGLISSTILTLVVVPVLITYLDSLARRVRKLFPKAPDDSHAETPAPAGPEAREASAKVVRLPEREPPAAYPEAAE